MNKVIIAGSRNFTNYTLLKEKLDYYLQNLKDIEIVSGGCRGTDKLGERYTKERGLPYKIFEADWDKCGKSAGYKRNKEMVEYSTHLIAFIDSSSKGTRNMCKLAEDNDLLIKIVEI